MEGTVYVAMTLDGYIARPDGSLDFLDAFHSTTSSSSVDSSTSSNVVGNQNSDDMPNFDEFLESMDAIVMGRKTFEKVLSFGVDVWPYGSKPMVVWTRDVDSVTLPLEKKGFVQVSSKTPSDIMRDFGRREGCRRIYVDGGATVQAFMKDGLIQNFHLTVLPIVLGEGIPLFRNQEVKLNLERSQAYPNGMVTLVYTTNRA